MSESMQAKAVKGRVIKNAADRTESLYPAARLVKRGVVDAQQIIADAKRLRAEAEEEAKRIRDEAIADADDIKQQGIDEARREALTEIKRVLENIDLQTNRLNSQFADEVGNVSLRLARAILDVEFETKPEVIAALVAKVLKKASMHRQITISLHPSAIDYVRPMEAELHKQLPFAKSIHFNADPELPTHGTRIETEMGAYDGSIETQFEGLKQHLRDVIAKGI